jgi:signal peptidase I
VAVEGQTVEVRDKILYVDGEEFTNPPLSKYTKPNIPRPPGGQDTRDNWGPYVVPKECYFMMGDNRDNSYDSRYWRAVHKDLVLGKALFIHWSWGPDENSPGVSVKDPLSVPRLFMYNFIHFPERVRWGRLFDIIR